MSLYASDQLSLRHLPADLSDQSVSFQIPAQVDSSNLLDDVAEDFFAVAMDSLNTPMPQKLTVEPASRHSPTLVPTNPVVQDLNLIASRRTAPVSAGLVTPPTTHAKPESIDSRASWPTEFSVAGMSDSRHPFTSHEQIIETVPHGGSSVNTDAKNQNSAKPIQSVKSKTTAVLPPKYNAIRRGTKVRPKPTTRYITEGAP
jgi:hypothetical protein